MSVDNLLSLTCNAGKLFVSFAPAVSGKAAKAMRQQMRRRTDPVAPDELPSKPAGDDVEAEALTRISTEEALAMIAALPPEQAEVVLLRVLGGFSAAEVGAMTGRRPGTVRVVQHRALARLARDLAKGQVTERPIQAM